MGRQGSRRYTVERGYGIIAVIPLGGLLLITWTYDGRLHERVFVVLCTCPLSCIFDPYVRTPLKMMINTCTIHPAVTMRNVQGGVQYKGLIPPTMMGRTSYFNRTIQSPRMKFANFFAQNQPPCTKPVVVNFVQRGRFRARQLDRAIEIFFVHFDRHIPGLIKPSVWRDILPLYVLHSAGPERV